MINRKGIKSKVYCNIVFMKEKKPLLKLLLSSLFLVLLISSIANCQIPNAGFESWTNGNPDGWVTDNDLSAGFVPVTLTTDSHSGNSALKGEVISLQGIPLNPILGTVFPYSERPTNFTGYYKFNSVDADSMVILVSFGSHLDINGVGGGGSIVVKNIVNDYKEFNIPINWVSQNPPDSCIISFTVFPASPHAHAGTSYFIDDLSFNSKTTSVESNSLHTPKSFELNQNYPNPFNPSTIITYSIPKESHVTLTVFNIVGQEVETLVNKEKAAGKYNVKFDGSGLGSGVYIYCIKVGNYFQQRKMLLLK